MENTATKALFDLLVTRDLEPEILDHNGKPVTDPADAEMFSFDWKTENKNYGTVVILMGTNNDMQVYFGDNLGRTMEGDDKADWYNFLQQLKSYATRNLLTFEINNINRLKYTMQGMAAIKEGLFEGYYGKKKVSYSDQPAKVRLVIKHNKDIAEGEARHRAIESLFLETADGERFKLPFKNLTGGRAMARHVAEGGNPYDAFGQHIAQLILEMHTMARFVRAAKNKEFGESSQELVEAAIRHYSDIKAKAKKMIGQRGYHEERENFDPAQFTDSEVTTEAIRDMFIEKSIDHRIEEALPILTRLANKTKEDKMKEIREFEEWSNRVMEGTWSLPDTPEASARLQELLSKPLIVGPDATNATEQLYDLVGDDVLFDALNDLADTDPNANVWDNPAVMARLEDLGVDTGSAGTANEGAAVDAYMAGKSPALAHFADQLDKSAEVEEGILDTAKKFGGKVLDKLGHGSDEDMIRDLQRKAGLPQTGFKPSEDPQFKDKSQVMAKQLARQNPGDPVGNFAKGGKQLGIFKDDIDTDGVMMTKASNMSS